MSEEKKCYWLDEFNICCNPFQTIPYSMKCPDDPIKCAGYAKDGEDAASKTKITFVGLAENCENDGLGFPDDHDEDYDSDGDLDESDEEW